MRKRYLVPVVACIVVIVGIICYYFFAGMLKGGETKYVYIDSDDNIDSVYHKLEPVASHASICAFKTLARHTGYAGHIREGRYAVEKGVGALQTFRHFRNGMQAPVDLTIPSVRTTERLAEELSQKLEMSRTQLLEALTSPTTCAKYGYTPETILCIFIPNTYSVYWTISVDKLLDRMQKESRKFWNFDRTEKAKKDGLTPVEVITLASIVDEETANDAEKPMIAGMYINRLHSGMPLQADPTIKFATKNFDAKRIYTAWTQTDSPYNTYRNEGLPPGPIRIPTVAGIDAVLNYVHHDYLYMCAKEDFSGTHNFARTYPEHLVNAKKYSDALNERGIK